MLPKHVCILEVMSIIVTCQGWFLILNYRPIVLNTFGKNYNGRYIKKAVFIPALTKLSKLRFFVG